MRRILCYGDSNTFGTGPMETLLDQPSFSKSQRWAGVMAEELGGDWDVVVEGLPGRTTALDDPIEGWYLNGRHLLKPTLLTHAPIDMIIICLGTNDTQQRYGMGTQEIALGVARLLQDSAALNVVDKTLVVCPPPVRELGDLAEIFSGAERRSQGLPKQMERFSTVHGAAFLDAGDHIEVHETDGVHWGLESHSVLGGVVAKKVQEMFA